jgi:hypothetical protein
VAVVVRVIMIVVMMAVAVIVMIVAMVARGPGSIAVASAVPEQPQVVHITPSPFA